MSSQDLKGTLSQGKPRVIALHTELTSLAKKRGETVSNSSANGFPQCFAQKTVSGDLSL